MGTQNGQCVTRSALGCKAPASLPLRKAFSWVFKGKDVTPRQTTSHEISVASSSSLDRRRVGTVGEACFQPAAEGADPRLGWLRVGRISCHAGPRVMASCGAGGAACTGLGWAVACGLPHTSPLGWQGLSLAQPRLHGSEHGPRKGQHTSPSLSIRGGLRAIQVLVGSGFCLHGIQQSTQW